MKQAKPKQKPVPIVHLQLSYRTGTPEQRERIRAINRFAVDLAAVRLRGGPIASLVDRRKIGPEELQAAQDIEMAFTALTIGLGFKPLSLERKDPSTHHEPPVAVLDAVRRYQDYAQHWSMRRAKGDRSLEIVIAAVIDERSLSSIEDDIGIRNGKAGQVVARMLRDYAARAGWVSSRLAAQWKAEAGQSFKLHDPLTLAVARHNAARAEELA